MKPLRKQRKRSGPARTVWEVACIAQGGEELLEQLYEGFDFDVFEGLAAVSGIDKAHLARVTRLSKSTLERRKETGRFTADESDRLYRFARVLDAATELFEGDQAGASDWLERPVRGLGNRAPLEMLGTSAEYQLVLDLISRLEHGIPT